MRARLVVWLLLGICLAVPTGCGSDDDAQSAAQRLARENAADRAAMAKRLSHLREEVRRRRKRVAAEHREAASESGRAQESTGRATADAAGGFDRLAAELNGEVGAAIGPPGSAEAASFGDLQSGPAWSTSKVPIALHVLDEAGGPAGLSSTQAAEMRSALTLSDNEAAAALFADLERHDGGLVGASAAVEEVLREGGDTSTVVSTQSRGEFSTYGQTEWSLADQQRFMSSLAAGCVVGPESSGYVLGLMGEVSSDTWGLGSASLPARWKGGWGPGVDGAYLVRQMGVLYVGGKQAVVTLAARPADGQFGSGEAMATAVAQWLAAEAANYAATPTGC